MLRLLPKGPESGPVVQTWQHRFPELIKWANPVIIEVKAGDLLRIVMPIQYGSCRATSTRLTPNRHCPRSW